MTVIFFYTTPPAPPPPLTPTQESIRKTCKRGFTLCSFCITNSLELGCLLFDLPLTTPVRQSLFYLWSYSYARRDKPRGEMSPVRGGQMRRMASSGASQISRAFSVRTVRYNHAYTPSSFYIFFFSIAP